ncbi:MAG: hypothetical protein M1830_006330, partial [Pleopsidium flavum]
MTSKGFRFLRPYLCRDLRPLPGVACRAHLRFYSVTRSCNSSFCRIFKRFSTPLSKGEVQQRVEELRSTEGLTYPRIGHDEHSLVCKTFYKRYSILKAGERDNGTRVVLHGRVQSFRSAGSKLAFIDLVEDGQRIQGLCNFSVIGNSECSAEAFRTFQRLLHRGDILCEYILPSLSGKMLNRRLAVTGVPYRSNRGELSIEATELPKLLSPCLHHLPEKLEDKQVRVRNRHTDLLVNQQSANVLRLRSQIIQNVRQFLLNDGFMEVETPILADSASGAIARAFKTTATEFPLRRLSLRIAPELWLKRLVMGGFDRVFEIGRSFRNE